MAKTNFLHELKRWITFISVIIYVSCSPLIEDAPISIATQTILVASNTPISTPTLTPTETQIPPTPMPVPDFWVQNGQLVKADGKPVMDHGIPVLVDAIFTSTVFENKYTLVKDGKPVRLVYVNEDDITQLENLGVEDHWFDGNNWYRFDGRDWSKLPEPPVTDSSTYITKSEEMDENQRGAMERAGAFPFVDKEGYPVILAFSKALNRPVAMRENNLVVGVFDVDGSGVWWRGYGFQNTVFLSDDPLIYRYLLLEKNSDKENVLAVRYALNFLRMHIVLNQEDLSEYPDRAWDVDNLYFVGGEGGKEFLVGSNKLVYISNLGMNFDLQSPLYLQVVKGELSPIQTKVSQVDGNVMVKIGFLGNSTMPYITTGAVRPRNLNQEKVGEVQKDGWGSLVASYNWILR